MHHMLEEIISEPTTVESFKSREFPDVEKITRAVGQSEIVYAIGNGTSYHAAYYFSILLNRKGINCITIYSDETSKWIRGSRAGAVSVLFSQSGESIDIINSAKELKKMGSTIVGITNSRDSKLDLVSDLRILTDVGEELSIPATKSHLSQLLAALKISIGDNNQEYTTILERIARHSRTIIANMERIRELAESLPDNTVFLGSGLLYPVALEASLKLLESSNAISYAFPVKEFLHGPKQILDKNWSILMLSADRNVAQELKKYSREVIDVTDFLREKFQIVEEDEVTMSITSLIFCQLFSYYSSVKHDFNPDRPSKLSKVVT